MRALLQLAVVLLGVAASASAQPNISGTWVVVPERSRWSSPDGHVRHIRVLGEAFLASLTRGALTLILDDEGVPRRYALDGQAHLVPHPGPRGLEPLRVVAGWVGPRLVIRLQPVNEPASAAAPETSRSLQLQADGTLLVTAPWGPDEQPLSTVYRRTH
jgi:hypothetical protein